MSQFNQSLPWWATSRPDPMGRPDPMSRASLLGTADPVSSSFFYYDGDNLVETTDESEFNGASEGFYDVTRMDYYMDPLRKQTMLFDPWKQNNLMSMYDGAFNQAMDYEGVTDANVRGSLRRWYNFDRPDGFGGIFDTVVSGLKFGATFQDASGSLTSGGIGLQEMFNALDIVQIQEGDASKYDVPLAIKEAAKSGNTPIYAIPPDVTHKLEARSSRFLRARNEFDPDFNSSKAWKTLNETQRRFLESRGYNEKTWLTSADDRANNAIDYFSTTETFIRQQVYQDQLAVFNNKTIVNWLPQYLVSGTVNSLVNDIDNQVLTALTAPAGGWGAGSSGVLGKVVGGTLGRFMPQWAKAISLSAPAKTTLIEGAALGGMQAVGGSEALRQMTIATSGEGAEEEPSYTMEAIYGAAMGSAFVGLIHTLPRLIKGATVAGFERLPASTQSAVLNTPIVGPTVDKWAHTDSLRRIMANVGADADQFYLFNYLTPNEAALLMNEENLGRGMIERTLESYYGIPMKDLKDLHRYLDRSFLHNNGVSFVDIAEQVKMIVTNSPDYLKIDPAKLSDILDDYVQLADATRIKGDVAAFRTQRSKFLSDMINVRSGDIRHNVAKPLTKRERRLLQEYEAPIVKAKGESAEAFRTREFKRELKKAQLLARSEFLPDLVKARDLLNSLTQNGIDEKWIPSVVRRLDRSIESTGIKSELDRQIFLVSSVVDEAAADKGVKLKSLEDLGVKSDTIRTVQELSRGLKKYKEDIRKAPENKNKKAQNEYLKITKERYAEHLRVLDEIKGKELFDYRGRGISLGTTKEYLEWFEKNGIDPETADSPGYTFSKDIETINAARAKRDSALRRAAKESDTGKARDIREAAIAEYVETREKTFSKYAPSDPKVAAAMDNASIYRSTESFNQLHPETQKTILGQMFDNIAYLGTEVGELSGSLVRMVENTPFKQRISLILSQVATWPQTQKNTFLSHMAAVRGLAVLHDDSLSFASTFRTLSNPVSLRAASYSAIADALPVVQIGMRLKNKYGTKLKGVMNAHVSEIRQSGKKFEVSTLPDELKKYGDQIVKELSEWNEAMTVYFTNVLTSGHEVSLIKSGIDPSRYLPHRLPLDMTPEATKSFVDKFVKLRLAQFGDNTPLDLTTMEALGWIVRLDNDRDFSVPDGSPLRMDDMKPAERVEAVRKLISKGARGIEELQRLQPPPSKASTLKLPGFSKRQFRSKVEFLKANQDLPPLSPTDARFQIGPQMTDREVVDAFWAFDENQSRWSEPENMAFMTKFADEVARRFDNKRWTRAVDYRLVDDPDEFSKLSPWHDHVQKLWQKFGVIEEADQAILRAAYARVPKSVIAIRVMANQDESPFAFAYPKTMSIVPGEKVNPAELFLHETGHWEVFRNEWLWDVLSEIQREWDIPSRVKLLRDFGMVSPQDILYALWNPDEFGAVLWDSYMRSRAAMTPSTNPALHMIKRMFERVKNATTFMVPKDAASEAAQLIRRAFSSDDLGNLRSKLQSAVSKGGHYYVGSENLSRALDEALAQTLGIGVNQLEDLIDPTTGGSVKINPNQGILKLWEDASISISGGSTRTQNISEGLARWKSDYNLSDESLGIFVSLMGSLKHHIETIQLATDVNLAAKLGSPGIANDIMKSRGDKLMEMLDKAVGSLKKTFRNRSREDISDIVYGVYADLLDDTDGPAGFDAYVRNKEGTTDIDVDETFNAMTAILITRGKDRMKDMFRNEDRRANLLRTGAREKSAPRELSRVEAEEVLRDWESAATGKKKATLSRILPPKEAKKKVVQTVAKMDRRLAETDKSLATPEQPAVISDSVEPRVSDPEVQKVIDETPLASEVLERAIEEGDLDAAAAVVAAAEDLVESERTSPSPSPELRFTPENIQRVLKVTSDQANALVALADTMGLPRDRLMLGLGDSTVDLEQSAWHGTPHRFVAESLIEVDGQRKYVPMGQEPDGAEIIARFPNGRFKLQGIGTGEGAQAFGWGLYFASEKKVAESYRRGSEPDEILFKGKPIDTFVTIADAYGMSLSRILFKFEDNLIRGMSSKQAYDSIRARLIEDINNNVIAIQSREGSSSPSTQALVKSLKSYVENDRGDLKTLEGIDPADITLKRGHPGSLFEVDLAPKEDEWLDLDLPFSKQSDKVREAVTQILGEAPTNDTIGTNIYTLISLKQPHSSTMRSDEWASRILREHGVRGNRYLDGFSRRAGEGSRNYVLFDDADVSILNLHQGVKGGVAFAEDGKAIIRGITNPDVSTGAHELAHVARRWLLSRDVSVEARRGITDEHIRIAEEWAGAKDGVWDVQAEERFARGFERYLRDGTAPTPALKPLFESFREWLVQIYRKIIGTPLNLKISPAMKDVFDSLVTRGPEIKDIDPKPQEAPSGASEAQGSVGTTLPEESIPGPSTASTEAGTTQGPPGKPPKGPRKASGGSEPPKPPTGATLEGVDPEWFYERKRLVRDSKKGFTRIRDKWKLLGVLPTQEDLAKQYREGFKDSTGYTQEFKTLHPGKLGVQVAAERYVDKMTGRSIGRGSATDIRDIRAAVQRNSRPDSIEGGDRVFDDADFATPEGQALAREFGMLNNLDALVVNYARSSGTRINAHMMLRAMLRETKHPGWDGSGVTWSDLYDHVESSLKTLMATQADGSIKTLSSEDNEIINSTMDQFREKYLRAIGKFPLQDQDKTFNSITMIARNMTLGLLAPMTAPTISMVEVPIAIGRAFAMNPKQGAVMALELTAEAFTSSPFGKMLGFKGSRGLMEDLITYAESLDASPIGKLTGEHEDIGMGLAENMKERLQVGWRRAKADLMKDETGRRDRDALLKFLVHGTSLVAQTSADVSSLRWGTELAKFMGANQAKRELISFAPNLMKFRDMWDETLLGGSDKDRERVIMGWLRQTGTPYHVWNRAQRKGLLKPGILEAVMDLSSETKWGDKTAKAITLDLNRMRNRMLDMDAEYRLRHMDSPRGHGELERREAVTATHSYIEEGVNIFSPELRGIFRLDRQDQLTPWKRLLFFWQNYPMAFFNTNIQQAFRNQRVPMALANVFGLYVLELNARMVRDMLMADSEERRKEAVARWKRLVSLDPTDMSSELLQGAPMVPVLGHSQFLLSDITLPFASKMLDRSERNRQFPKTFGSSPVMSVANRLYRNFVTNPIEATSSSLVEGRDDRWSGTLGGIGQTTLDMIPFMNSWGRMGWNAKKMIFSKEAITNPYDQLPRSVTDWVTTVQEDLAPKREKTSTMDGMFKTSPPQEVETSKVLNPLEELRKPLG